MLRSLVAACPSISNGATRARILAILADFLPLHPGEDGGASNELMHLLQAHLELDGSAQGFGAGRRRRELLLASKAGRFGVASPVYGTGNGSTAGAGSGGGQAGWVGGWGGPDSEFFAHCLLRCAIRCPALAAAVEEVLAQVSARAVRSLQLSASGEQAEEGWKEEGRYAAGADSSGGSGDSGWGGGKMGGERRLVPPMLLRLEAVRALLVQHYPHLAQPGACAAPPAAPHTSAPALAAGMDAQKGACAAVGGWPLVCTAPPSEEVAAPAPCYRILDVVTGNDTALHGNPFDPPSSPGLGAGRAMAGGVAGVEGGVGSGREDGDALEALVPEAVWRVWGAEYGGGDAGGGGVGGSGLSVGLGWGVSGGVPLGDGQGADGEDRMLHHVMPAHVRARLVSQSPELRELLARLCNVGAERVTCSPLRDWGRHARGGWRGSGGGGGGDSTTPHVNVSGTGAVGWLGGGTVVSGSADAVRVEMSHLTVAARREVTVIVAVTNCTPVSLAGIRLKVAMSGGGGGGWGVLCFSVRMYVWIWLACVHACI